jgi:hypothetical protein
MATNASALTSEFFQFMEDIPFGSLAAAVTSGGADIPLDVGAAEAIVAAVVKDFFSGNTAKTAGASVAVAAGAPSAAAAAAK